MKPAMKLEKGIDNSLKYKLLFALFGLVGTGTIIFATSHYGAGISPDSVGYISVARHLADGVGFITYDNTPLVVQPPLYPAILAAIDFIFGVDPLLSANIVSAIFFGFTLYLSGLLFFKHLTSFPFLALIGTAFLLVSISLIGISLMAWSEPPFIFFVVLYLISISMYLENKNIKSLLLLSLSVALLCLTRYIGVAFILTGIISILLIRQADIKIKSRHVFIFLLISVLPIGIWVSRNYFLSETLFGPRSPSLRPLYDNIQYTFNTISGWYLPNQITEGWRITILLSLIIVFLVRIIFVWVKMPIMTLIKQEPPFVVYILLVIFGYIGLLIFSSTTTHFDQINNRLLSPIVVPLTLLLLSIIEILSKLIKVKFVTKPVELLIIVGMVLWLIFPTSASAIKVNRHFNKGNGYGAKPWKNSQTIQYIRENNLSNNCTIYSNGVDVTYLLLNINVKSIPLKRSGATVIADIISLENTFPLENKACIVWFNKITWRTYLFTPDELALVTNSERTVQLDDGAIYFVSKK